jgi:hypothetical protein
MLPPRRGGATQKIAQTQNCKFCQFGVLFVTHSLSACQKIVKN